MFNPVNICSEMIYKKCGKYKLEIIINFRNFNIYQPQIHENNELQKLCFIKQDFAILLIVLL